MATAATPVPLRAEPARILIVDDHVPTLRALEAALTAEGHEVVTARAGEEALRLLLQRDFALVLLDLVMPGIGGLELARLIRQRPRNRDLPLVFLTGHGEAAQQAYAAGAVDYLEKPVDADVVRAKVTRLVQLYRRGEALVAEEHRARQRELLAVEERSRRRYRNLVEALPQIVWIATRDGALEYLNQPFLRYTGLDPARAAGWGWTEAVHPDDTPGLLDRWQAAVRQERPLEAEARLRRHDEVYRWHLWRAVPEREGEGGQVLAWLGSATDIADQKEIEAELRVARGRAEELYEEARRAVALREEFLSVASHELRTPLSALSLSVELMGRVARREGASEGLQRRIAGAGSEVRRLSHLVGQLLDVTRISADGTLHLEPSEVDLLELTREVAETLEPEAQRAGCPVTIRGVPARGRWDRIRVAQVITNLLANAFKYGAGTPVEVTVEADRGRARLTVADRGAGLDAAEQERVFERFTRGAAHPGAGLGLGLYIARQIVIAHDGTIGVDSRPGEGARFRVELPLDEPALVVAAADDGAAGGEAAS